MQLKPFAVEKDLARERAAHEVQPISIPFKHSEFLKDQYSGGKTEYCFFLKSKTTGEVFPWNSHMAENGNVHYFPHFDLNLLNDESFAGTVAIWAQQGILPKGYGPKPKSTAAETTRNIPEPRAFAPTTRPVAGLG